MWTSRKILVLFIVLPRMVLASCGGQGLGILWSFPADGAVDVPTNVAIWLVPQPYAATTVVELDGQVLTRAGTTGGERFHWVGAGPLDPNTSHTITLTQGLAGAPQIFTRSFTTGAGPLAASTVDLGISAVTFVSRGPYGGEEWLDEVAACREVTMNQGCHDSGRMGRLSIETSTTAAFWSSEDPAYWERGSVWPGECGRPAMVHVRTQPVCAIWRPMDAAGHPMGSATTCLELPEGAAGDIEVTRPYTGVDPDAGGADTGDMSSGAETGGDGAAGGCQTQRAGGAPESVAALLFFAWAIRARAGRRVLLAFVAGALGCQGAAVESTEDVSADAPDVAVVLDSSEVLDMAEVVDDLVEVVDVADPGEPLDTAPEVDDVAIEPCEIPGIPTAAVRCYEPSVSDLIAVDDWLLSVLITCCSKVDVLLSANSGDMVDTADIVKTGWITTVQCGSSACLLYDEANHPDKRFSSREVAVESGHLVLKPASAPLPLPSASGGFRFARRAEVPTFLMKAIGESWRRCRLGPSPSCEDVPLPVECEAGQVLSLTDIATSPTSSIIAGHCTRTTVEAPGEPRAFVFEWEHESGVVWTTAPDAWRGISELQLFPSASGYWLVANRFSDASGYYDEPVWEQPMGLTVVHIRADGVPGERWDTPFGIGAMFSATAAVRGDDLLVAWKIEPHEGSSEIRLTLATPDVAPTTAILAPPDHWLGDVVAYGDGYVLNLSGSLVRLDATGAPVAWPASP